ncbi:hypothetical protein V6Z11_D01G228000 [Gossypium hirsutum]
MHITETIYSLGLVLAIFWASHILSDNGDEAKLKIKLWVFEERRQ